MKFICIDVKGLGADLQRIRKHLRITFRQLAQESGLTISHIYNLEKGRRQMTLEKFFILCTAMGVAADDLIADNTKIDHAGLLKLCADNILKGSPKANAASVKCAAAYQAGWTVILCHLLLSPGGERIHSGDFDLPTDLTMQDTYVDIQNKIRAELSLQNRRSYLHRLIKNPASVLLEFGLMEDKLVAEFANYSAKHFESGKKEPLWCPIRKRSISFYLMGDNLLKTPGGSLAGEAFVNRFDFKKSGNTR